jgi:hypothetical protein
MPLDQATAIVPADTNEGVQLRPAHPFAAILTQDHRRNLRNTACLVENSAIRAFEDMRLIAPPETRHSCEVISGIGGKIVGENRVRWVAL